MFLGKENSIICFYTKLTQIFTFYVLYIEKNKAADGTKNSNNKNTVTHEGPVHNFADKPLYFLKKSQQNQFF